MSCTTRLAIRTTDVQLSSIILISASRSVASNSPPTPTPALIAIASIGRPLDAIAINAGIGVGGEFEATELEQEIQMIELNCTAVVRIAKLAVQEMLPRRSGKILITSSIAATMPAPYEAVYGGTKAFDLIFAEGLRAEVKDKGITVTALQPGPTETEFFHRAELDDTKVGQEKKDDPAQVAKQGYEALKSGKDKVYAGSLKTRLQGLATEVLPEEMKAKQHAKMGKPLDKKD